MAAERAGWCKLAELVTDHRLGHVDRDMLATVVNGDRVANHFGKDRGRT